MTKDRNWKQQVRAFADSTGMRYAAAHRALSARQVSNGSAPTELSPTSDLRSATTPERTAQRPDARAASLDWMKPPHLAPAASLDYLRALALARRAAGLLANTSELAWQIYGVSSPQGRDGDQILSKGQYLKDMLRSDAFDLWVVNPGDKEEEEVENVFRRFYPPITGILAELSEEARLHYRGRGSRGRCPKAMPLEAHRAVAQAHREAEDALRQLEAILAPHHRHPGTDLRLKACRRLAELTARQTTAFGAAMKAEHRNKWDVVIARSSSSAARKPSESDRLDIKAVLKTSDGEYVASAVAFLRDFGGDEYSPEAFGYKECGLDQLLFLNFIPLHSSEDPPGGESACIEKLIEEAERLRRHLVTQVQALNGDNDRLAAFLRRFGFERVDPPIPGVLLMRRHSASLSSR